MSEYCAVIYRLYQRNFKKVKKICLFFYKKYSILKIQDILKKEISDNL